MTAKPGERPCRGRFAPSPSGPLHLGSLVAALASYLDTLHHGGDWLLRIEDIDPPREMPGAAASIRDTLQRHQLNCREAPLYQSTRYAAYREALQFLKDRDLLFPCVCTRAELGPRGSCGRRCNPQEGQPQALRLELPAEIAGYRDLICGPQPAITGGGDLVLWRKDGLPAYALAVSVDDHWQGITRVVRGADLLTHTPLQRHLIGLLGGPIPDYGHVPVVRGDDGRKLSKQNGAPALDNRRPMDNLRAALRALGQASAEATAASPEALLENAIAHWQPGAAAARGTQDVAAS